MSTKPATIFEASSVYLVGIKGVAMTSLAQCLVDLGKTVVGCDTAEAFVTQDILDTLKIKLITGFDQPIPETVDCVVYTAAHGGPANAVVTEAKTKQLLLLSQAEAIAQLANKKQAIAVCGVGGKSTVSAMITWILEQTGKNPSYSVGVGSILGLPQTGKWNEHGEYFVVEADEYVTDPAATAQGKEITPRFSYLYPFITVCTNLLYDHPDVYEDFAHTKRVFKQFFKQNDENGFFVYNSDDLDNLPRFISQRGISFGSNKESDVRLDITTLINSPGSTSVAIYCANTLATLKLALPGVHNLFNAAAALAVTTVLDIPLADALQALETFASTKRRFELIGTKNEITYYDDYAHHPREIKATIAGLKSWYPDQRTVVAFQPHTFSRTKELFADFVESFSTASEVIILDIFASARESFDDTISSADIVNAIKEAYPEITVTHMHTIDELADFCRTSLKPTDVFLTMGAGDIYKVHELV